MPTVPFLPHLRRPGPLAAALLACALAACSPVFNWREVPFDGELTLLLPCKPDRAQRTLPLGEAAVPLDMIGCEAGGATFALARLPAGDPAQASLRAEAWRAAARRPWAGAQLSETPITLPRAAEAPAPVELVAHGPAAEARMRWFAHADARGALTLYQATVLGHPSEADAVATFFEGLKLR